VNTKDILNEVEGPSKTDLLDSSLNTLVDEYNKTTGSEDERKEEVASKIVDSYQDFGKTKKTKQNKINDALKILKFSSFDSVKRNKSLLKDILNLALKKLNDKTKTDAKEYESFRAKKNDGILYKDGDKNSKVVFDDRASKIAKMVANNNFVWDVFTNAIYKKGDFTTIGKKSVSIPGGTMKDVKSTEVKLNPSVKKGDSFRYIDFIAIKGENSFNNLKKSLEDKTKKKMTNKQVADIWNTWISNIAIKELKSKKGKTILKKALKDNKENTLEIGSKNKTIRDDNFSLDFNLGGLMSPSTGHPKLKRILMDVKVSEDSNIVDSIFYTFQGEILNG